MIGCEHVSGESFESLSFVCVGVGGAGGDVRLRFITFENQGTVDSMILKNIGCTCDVNPL